MATRVAGAGVSVSDPWLQIAVRYLARVDRSSAQVEEFLQRKGASPAQAKQTVDRLSQLRYLNDRAYGERWAEARLARQPVSRERLKAELTQKGLDERLVEDIVGRALGTADQEAWARRALDRKERRNRKLSSLQAVRLLRQWGFEEDTIARIIEARRSVEGMET